jgi:hypothetical protein
VNREDSAAVIHSGDRVHIGAIEQVAPEGSTSSVGHDARWQHQAQTAARPQQLQSTLDEQLIAVRMCTAVHDVYAGVAEECSRVTRLSLAAIARVTCTAVASDHVPWRVPDDRVESSRPEDLRERQRPMKKPLLGSHLIGVVEERLGHACRYG